MAAEDLLGSSFIFCCFDGRSEVESPEYDRLGDPEDDILWYGFRRNGKCAVFEWDECLTSVWEPFEKFEREKVSNF